MKDQNLIIRIAEPCHEDWNNMQPDAKGKFCGSCNKAVFDFSNKTDTEIKDILVQYKDQSVCGHFKKTQVNRPLNFRINFNELPKNMSSTKTFAVALFLVFGTFLFSCTNPEGKKVDSLAVVTEQEKYEAPLALTIKEDSLKKDPSELTTSCYDTGERMMGAVAVVETPDTIPAIQEITETETHVMGMMMYHVPEITDTTNVDSLNTNKNKQIADQFTNEETTELLVFPNPSRGQFTLKYSVLKRADVRADIFDERGALLKTVINIGGQFEGNYQVPVDLNELPNGIYSVSLINNGKRFTKRVVIEK